MGVTEYGRKRENVQMKMLAYMKHKYGEEFVFVESYAGQIGENYTMILVKSRQKPERQVLVRLTEKEGKSCFADNYPAYFLKEQLEKCIGGLAEQSFGTCKVYYKIPEFVFPAEFKADMEPDVFLKHPGSMPQFYIYPENTEGDKQAWEEKLQNFRTANAKRGYQIRGTVSLADSERDYEMITENSFADRNYEGYQAKAELIFSIDGKGTFRYMRWL